MFLEVLKKLKEHNFFSAAAMSTSVDLQKPLTILQNSGMLLAKYYMHVYVNPDLFPFSRGHSIRPLSLPRVYIKIYCGLDKER